MGEKSGLDLRDFDVDQAFQPKGSVDRMECPTSSILAFTQVALDGVSTAA